jgi:hypothetical protein
MQRATAAAAREPMLRLRFFQDSVPIGWTQAQMTLRRHDQNLHPIKRSEEVAVIELSFDVQTDESTRSGVTWATPWCMRDEMVPAFC